MKDSCRVDRTSTTSGLRPLIVHVEQLLIARVEQPLIARAGQPLTAYVEPSDRAADRTSRTIRNDRLRVTSRAISTGREEL